MIRTKENNALKVLDTNDYYPFGMNFLANALIGESVFNPQTSPLNYKFQGQELQETGAYDFNARMYFPDIVRTPQIDPLSEVNPHLSGYSFLSNNPINRVDPTGMLDDWYENNVTQNIEWHDGSAEISGYTNLTQKNITGFTEYFGGELQAVTNLNSNGTVTRTVGGDSTTYSYGDSATMLSGTSVKSGNNSGGFLDWLSNTFSSSSDTFYQDAGGNNTDPIKNTAFRPGIDKNISVDGYFGIFGGVGKLDTKMGRPEAVLGALEKLSGLSFGSNKTWDLKTSIPNIDSSKVGTYSSKDTIIRGVNSKNFSDKYQPISDAYQKRFDIMVKTQKNK